MWTLVSTEEVRLVESWVMEEKWNIDKFDETTWKFQLKHFLLAKDLWKYVDGSAVLAEDATAEQWGISIDMHPKEMKELTDKLSSIGALISEEDQIVTLLGSLPPSFSTVVTALEARVDDLTMDFVPATAINSSWTKAQSSRIKAWSLIWFSTSGSSKAQKTSKVLDLWWGWTHSAILSKAKGEITASSKSYCRRGSDGDHEGAFL